MANTTLNYGLFDQNGNLEKNLQLPVSGDIVEAITNLAAIKAGVPTVVIQIRKTRGREEYVAYAYGDIVCLIKQK